MQFLFMIMLHKVLQNLEYRLGRLFHGVVVLGVKHMNASLGEAHMSRPI